MRHDQGEARRLAGIEEHTVLQLSESLPADQLMVLGFSFSSPEKRDEGLPNIPRCVYPGKDEIVAAKPGKFQGHVPAEHGAHLGDAYATCPLTISPFECRKLYKTYPAIFNDFQVEHTFLPEDVTTVVSLVGVRDLSTQDTDSHFYLSLDRAKQQVFVDYVIGNDRQFSKGGKPFFDSIGPIQILDQNREPYQHMVKIVPPLHMLRDWCVKKGYFTVQNETTDSLTLNFTNDDELCDIQIADLKAPYDIHFVLMALHMSEADFQRDYGETGSALKKMMDHEETRVVINGQVIHAHLPLVNRNPLYCITRDNSSILRTEYNLSTDEVRAAALSDIWQKLNMTALQVQFDISKSPRTRKQLENFLASKTTHRIQFHEILTLFKHARVNNSALNPDYDFLGEAPLMQQGSEFPEHHNIFIIFADGDHYAFDDELEVFCFYRILYQLGLQIMPEAWLKEYEISAKACLGNMIDEILLTEAMAAAFSLLYEKLDAAIMDRIGISSNDFIMPEMARLRALPEAAPSGYSASASGDSSTGDARAATEESVSLEEVELDGVEGDDGDATPPVALPPPPAAYVPPAGVADEPPAAPGQAWGDDVAPAAQAGQQRGWCCCCSGNP